MTPEFPDPDRDAPFFTAMREQILATPLPEQGRRRLVHGCRWARPLPLAGAGIALAAGIVALVLALGAVSAAPAPAYALTVSQREITLTLGSRLRDLRGLDARLTALGARVQVVPVVRGCVAPVRAATVVSSDGVRMPRGPARTYAAGALGHSSHTVITVELYPSGHNWVPRGMTLVVPITRSGRFSVRTPVVLGPAPRCVGV